MKKIIDGKRYNTETAEKLADNYYRDGANRLANGIALTLYRTPRGRYFWLRESIWQGEKPADIFTVDELEIDMYDFFENNTKHTTFFAAFPDVTIEEA